jgi:coenzyme F420 hydrogenase subunit beta
VETVLHLRRMHPARIKNMVPAHVWQLVARYGLMPKADEQRTVAPLAQDQIAPPGKK